MGLNERVETLAREIVEREGEGDHVEALDRARAKAEALRALVLPAIETFNRIIAEAFPGLVVDVTPLRVDDKHVHSVEFDLERGRTRAIVTVKSKGQVTLVGPFQAGKDEGPCRRIPIEAEAEIESALVDFVEEFLEAATAP